MTRTQTIRSTINRAWKAGSVARKQPPCQLPLLQYSRHTSFVTIRSLCNKPISAYVYHLWHRRLRAVTGDDSLGAQGKLSVVGADPSVFPLRRRLVHLSACQAMTSSSNHSNGSRLITRPASMMDRHRGHERTTVRLVTTQLLSATLWFIIMICTILSLSNCLNDHL